MEILDRYIDQLLEKSSPQAPVWNIEKIKQGKKPSWNYIDGCMIKDRKSTRLNSSHTTMGH